MSIGLRQLLSKHCACLWSEKTTVCRIFSCQRSGLPDSAGNLVTSGTGRSATRAALKRSVPTSVQEKPEGLITPPKLFQIALVRRRACAFGLTRRNFCSPCCSPSPLWASAGQLFAYIAERKVGGEYRARTGDLLVANQALSQLS